MLVSISLKRASEREREKSVENEKEIPGLSFLETTERKGERKKKKRRKKE